MFHFIIHEIKKEKISSLKKWGKMLSGKLMNEAISTMMYEGIDQEMGIIFELKGKHYLFGMESRNKERIPANETMPINHDHKEILDKAIIKKAISKPELMYALRVFT